jgi:hypothetical protein
MDCEVRDLSHFGARLSKDAATLESGVADVSGKIRSAEGGIGESLMSPIRELPQIIQSGDVRIAPSHNGRPTIIS